MHRSLHSFARIAPFARFTRHEEARKSTARLVGLDMRRIAVHGLPAGPGVARVAGQAAARACSQRSTVALAWSTAASGVAP
jgi:hypothetical protein